MKFNIKDFRVQEKKVKFDKCPTLVKPVYKSKKGYDKLLQQLRLLG